MTLQEKQDLIHEIIPELVKGLVPVLKETIVEELKQQDTEAQNQNNQKDGEEIDYAALVKEALK